jgi:hypothetical protein
MSPAPATFQSITPAFSALLAPKVTKKRLYTLALPGYPRDNTYYNYGGKGYYANEYA